MIQVWGNRLNDSNLERSAQMTSCVHLEIIRKIDDIYKEHPALNIT